jgi:hypothetical protein
MTKAAASVAMALVALGALAQPSLAQTTACAYPPTHPAWIVAQGYSGSAGRPQPGPPWSWPLPTPRTGCYCFRQHRAGAWREIEVCE